MSRKVNELVLPSREEVQGEMRRVRRRKRFKTALKSTVGTVIVVAALAVLVAVILLPVLRVTGTSMEPNFKAGDILVAYKTRDEVYNPGDVVCFYYNNKIIIKRVIALGGDVVEIDEDTGRVVVNGLMLEEPYVLSYAFGQCDLDFPFEVPDGQLFLMGDNREAAVDSRTQAFGCIKQEDMLGKILVRAWPAQDFTWYGRELPKLPELPSLKELPFLNRREHEV